MTFNQCVTPSRARWGDGDGDRVLPATQARERVRMALHVDSFAADSFREHCMPWLLDPFSFLQGCLRSRLDAVCSVFVAFVFLVEASVTDDVLPAGLRVFASGLVRRSPSAFALLPASRVAGRWPFPFRPTRGAEAEARGVGRGPQFGFFVPRNLRSALCLASCQGFLHMFVAIASFTGTVCIPPGECALWLAFTA
jgi:hypothetical protein